MSACASLVAPFKVNPRMGLSTGFDGPALQNNSCQVFGRTLRKARLTCLKRCGPAAAGCCPRLQGLVVPEDGDAPRMVPQDGHICRFAKSCVTCGHRDTKVMPEIIGPNFAKA